jgi:hypothetical protein
MHERPNAAFSKIKDVAEKTKPIAVPTEQRKQRRNLESSAKLCLINSKKPLLRKEICCSIIALLPVSCIKWPPQYFLYIVDNKLITDVTIINAIFL